MAKVSCCSTQLAIGLLLITTALATLMISAEASGDHQLSWLHTATMRRPGGGSGCRGNIGECLAEEDEFDMGSESSRRILATTQYISYGALQRNTVPCSKRGASYYNCKEGAEANPYSRDCSAITRCRS